MLIISGLQLPIPSTRGGCGSLVSYCKTCFPSPCAVGGQNPTASLITTEARPSHCLVFNFTQQARRSCCAKGTNYRSGGRPRGPRPQLGSRVSFCRSVQATRAGVSFSRVTHKLNCNIAMSSFQLSVLIRPSWSATVSFLCGTPNLSALRLVWCTTDSSSNPTCCRQLLLAAEPGRSNAKPCQCQRVGLTSQNRSFGREIARCQQNRISLLVLPRRHMVGMRRWAIFAQRASTARRSIGLARDPKSMVFATQHVARPMAARTDLRRPAERRG